MKSGSRSLRSVPAAGHETNKIGKKAAFPVIAERRFQLRGPASRAVVVRIGTPDKHDRDFRCPFQIVGLSDDGIQYSHGVDSLQALNLAFVGVRRRIEENVKVLSGFFEDVSVENEYGSWDVTLPYWVCISDREQLARLKHFMEHEFWAKPKERDLIRASKKRAEQRPSSRRRTKTRR